MSEDAPQESKNEGFFGEIRSLYRASLKPKDIFWNLYVARPIAAFFLYFLRRSPITPNQLSFLGLFLFLGVPAAMILWPNAYGFLAAALILELSYVFDCADGQLARLKQMTSAVGMYLDFLIDEVKALLLVGGCAVAAWRASGGDELWLFVGLIGLVLVSSSTSLTTFVRRPAYAGEEIKPGADPTGPAAPKGGVAKVAWLFFSLARWIVHYPSWILYVACLGLLPQIDGVVVFLAAYLSVYVLYLGRTSLAVLIRLGHPRFYDRSDSST